ncbi:TPA: type III cell invasion protein SipB, partial [Escherichia coli]|nr:type III cell invasion protein SipB [Escherichia coli]
VLDSVCSVLQASAVVLKLIAKISNDLEKIGLLICAIATSTMNCFVAGNSADMAILQQDMSNLSKTREQMLSVLQRVDKTVEQEVSQMVRVLQHRTEALKFASHSIV